MGKSESLDFIAQTVVCPITGHALSVDGDTISAPSCEPYPQTAGIPWIFKNPRHQIAQWRYKIKTVVDYYQAQAARVDAELRKMDLLKSTRKRLEVLGPAYEKASHHFANLLQPLESSVKNTSDLEKIYFEKIPRQQTVMAYHDTVFRDWVWGADELKRQTEILIKYFNGTKRMLVLGAGACGLPLAIHRSLANVETLATDINPVLFLTAKKISEGGIRSLVEFPTVPAELSCSAIVHDIPACPLPKGFHMLFADGQSIATKEGVFDTLLTPWFIDIVPRNFRELSRHLNAALVTGGRWISVGLLDFHRNQPSEVLSREEIEEALMDAGFDLEEVRTVTIPYLQSKYNMIGRQDQVLVYSAVKKRSCKRPARFEYFPEWLRDWNLAIPQIPEIQNFQMKTNVFAHTVNLVDGSASLNNIAQTLSNRFGLPIEAARESVYNFMIQVYEQLVFREF